MVGLVRGWDSRVGMVGMGGSGQLSQEYPSSVFLSGRGVFSGLCNQGLIFEFLNSLMLLARHQVVGYGSLIKADW